MNSIFISLPVILKQRMVIRPADFRRILPEGPVRNIQSSDLTHILDFLVDIELLERLPPSRKFNIIKRPGHPSDHYSSRAALSGPKSLYKPSDFYSNIQDIISKPEAVRWIHTLLLESGLLYKYRKYVQLFIFDTMRNKKYYRETAWRICKSIYPLTSKEKENFENQYAYIRNINNRNDLVKQAEKIALTYVKDHSGVDYTEIFRVGAYYYRLYSD